MHFATGVFAPTFKFVCTRCLRIKPIFTNNLNSATKITVLTCKKNAFQSNYCILYIDLSSIILQTFNKPMISIKSTVNTLLHHEEISIT